MGRLGARTHPDVPGVVHVDGHGGGVDALDAADGDALGLVLVLVTGLPEGLGGAVREASDHGRTAGRLDIHHAGQVLQAGHHAQVLPHKHAHTSSVHSSYRANRLYTLYTPVGIHECLVPCANRERDNISDCSDTNNNVSKP